MQNTRAPTTHGTRFLAKVVGIVETYFNFAWSVGVVGVLWRLEQQDLRAIHLEGLFISPIRSPQNFYPR